MCLCISLPFLQSLRRPHGAFSVDRQFLNSLFGLRTFRYHPIPLRLSVGKVLSRRGKAVLGLLQVLLDLCDLGPEFFTIGIQAEDSLFQVGALLDRLCSLPPCVREFFLCCSRTLPGFLLALLRLGEVRGLVCSLLR